MIKVFFTLRKALTVFLTWIGPFGCAVTVIVLFLYFRNMMGSPDIVGIVDNREVSTDTVVTGIRKMSVLKPYKVITAGFDTVTREENGETAVLDYQYKGMAEFLVNLSSVEVEVEGGMLKVTLAMPYVDEPVMLSLPDKRLWHVTSSAYKMRKWKGKFRELKHEIMSRRMRQNIDTPENREKAKAQTERILRSLFLPIGIDESKIKFEWRDDTSSQQN